MSVTRQQHLLKLYAQILIWAHLAVSILHGTAHIAASVYLPFLGNLYVIVVILIAPLVALVWLSRSLHWGAALLAIAMAGSLIFGAVNHFILPGTDNAASVPGIWQMPFAVSAALVLLLEAIGTLLGIWLFAVTRPSVLKAQA